MDTLQQLSAKLRVGIDLTGDQATQAAELLAGPGVDVSSKADFLEALDRKGETADEVAAFAAYFRSQAIDPGVGEWAGRAIDVCGTGGDGASTFNISTTVSFVVAASGVPVFKHGNRSITSKCGSADLLEAVGVSLNASHETVRASLRELNYCFFFAPAYHPAFKEIMPVRRQLAEKGQRSIFNLLGPMINPGRPAHQLLGVFAERWVVPLSDALDKMGLHSGMVVHGVPATSVALDELSCAGKNVVSGLGALRAIRGELNASDASLSACTLADLKGGDVAKNVAMLNGLLSGDDSLVTEGLRNTVLLNAGAALWIAGSAQSLKAGVALADDSLKSGRVLQWLNRAKTFYQSIETQ